jgi:hypothetical protein
MTLQHLRSGTADKRPTPGAMSDGQLAINTNATSTGLFFKDSAGALVKVGPVHIGTTAPNATPASGGQSGNTVGEQWLDTTGGNYVLKIWDGSAWRSEAGEFVNASGDTMTGALVMDNQQQVRFRETTANGTNFIALQAPASVASDKTITLPDVTGTVVTTGDTGTVTSTMLLDGTIVNADVNASAAIAGTKISPDFGSQNRTSTGTSTAASFIPTGSTAPSNGLYLPSSNNVAISTNGTGRLFVDASGRVGIGSSGSGTQSAVTFIQGSGACPLEIDATAGSGGYLTLSNNGSAKAFFGFGSNIGTASVNDIALRSQSGAIVFQTGGATERMRLDSSGRLGLGTSSAGGILHTLTTGSDNVNFFERASGAKFGIYNSGTNSYIGTFSNHDLRFATNDLERFRCDTSGRLLVGTSTSIGSASGNYPIQAVATGAGGGAVASLGLSFTPDAAGYVLGGVEFNSLATSWKAGASVAGWSDGVHSSTSRPSRLVFSTCPDSGSSPVERMRITSAGSVGIGMTNPTGSFGDGNGLQFSPSGFISNRTSNPTANLGRNTTTGDVLTFNYGSTTTNLTQVGSVSVTASATAYNTSSDYRLKENVVLLTGAADRLKQIPVHRFSFIADPGKTIDGFLAHEAQAVVPECVTGTKDEVDDDGNPVYQGIDQSKLVPLLTAALQEALQKIEDLEGRLTAAGI